MNWELILEALHGWLARRYDLELVTESAEERGDHGYGATFRGAGRRVAIEGGILYGELLTAAFESRLRLFEREAGRGPPGSFLLWVPPGAEIPAAVEQLQPLVARLRETAAGMQSGEVRDIALPVLLRLRKTAVDGAYLTVIGGLAGHWSEMSRYVRGVYQLDSRPIHRLPRDEGFVGGVARLVSEMSQGMELGDAIEVPSADHWSLQRLERGRGLGVVAAPPEFDPADGSYVRRSLRRLVIELGRRLAEREGDLRVLVLVTALSTIREENIGPALVGFDPGMYTSIDLLCLAADGEMKAVLEPPAGAVPWLSRAS